MLCRNCRVHLHSEFPYCLHCGTLRAGVRLSDFHAPQLRRLDGDGAAVPLTKVTTMVGREHGNDLVLADASVSRQHARIVRAKGGFFVEDLNSFNGVGVGHRTLRRERMMLRDGTIMHFGDVAVIFEQPRGQQIGGKTMIKARGQTMLKPARSNEDTAPTATEPLSVRPRQRSGWALKQLPADPHGNQPWVLRNTATGKYLQLDEKDVFIWNQVDGTNTIRDLLFAFAEKYGELALPRIEQTLWSFAGIDLVRGLYGQTPPQKPKFFARIGQAVFKALLRMEVSFKGFDRLMGRIYRGFGWVFFTPVGYAVLWFLIVGGLVGMWFGSRHHRVLDLRGAGAWGALFVGVGYIAALIFHEGSHALAVKSYGRKVTRGGFLLMMGMPFAFVDTSDMWFGSRTSRLVVTLSGPLATAGLAGGLSLYSYYGGDGVWPALCYQLAIGLYLNTLYNLNPLLPLDGYQALSDALRMPRLREEATAYFTKGIWTDLRSGKRPGAKQLGLALYGLVALASLCGFAFIGLMMWRARLGHWVSNSVPSGLRTVVITLGIMIVFFPLWYMAVRKIRTVVIRNQARREGIVEAAP